MNAANPSIRSGGWRWAALALAAAAGLIAIERWQSGSPPLEQHSAAPTALSGLPRNYPDALARIDAAISTATAQAAAGSDQWLLHEMVARNYHERARLSGSYDDWAAAGTALDRAFAVALPRSGPHLARAQIDFGMHRLARAERQLALIDDYAIPPPPEERAEIAAMRGDIAFYRGDLKGATNRYDEADRLAPGTATFRRAIYASKTGNPEGVERYIDRSERETSLLSPHTRGYLELQRGILDLERERLDEALAHFRRADRMFPGHWLIEEHIAETLALQGHLAEAEQRYRDIIRRTGHPEFMDALAGVLEQQKKESEARRFRDQAWSVWQKRLKQFPEASYGHALDHCIDKGDWPCALRLARNNHAARPYGDAKIGLARALIGSGRVEEARSIIDSLRETPWRTPELQRIQDELEPVARASTN